MVKIFAVKKRLQLAAFSTVTKIQTPFAVDVWPMPLMAKKIASSAINYGARNFSDEIT